MTADKFAGKDSILPSYMDSNRLATTATSRSGGPTYLKHSFWVAAGSVSVVLRGRNLSAA